MKPYAYYKIKAHEKLRPNLLKSAAVGIFSLLLTLFLGIVVSLFKVENPLYDYLLNAAVAFLFLYPLSMGVGIFYLKVGRGEKPGVGTVFDGYIYFKKLIPYMLTGIIVSFISQYVTNLHSLASANGNDPGLVISVAVLLSHFLVMLTGMYLMFTFYIIYDNKDFSGFKAVAESFKMLRGNIIYFIGFILSFFFWIFLVVLTAGFAMLYLYPYMEIAIFMLYEEIKNKKNEDESEGE